MPDVAALNESDHAFLQAVASGETAKDYAARCFYGPDWPKWKSRRIRRILGVQTIREAIEMTDDTVSRKEFDTLTSLINRLGEGLEKLAERPDDNGRQQVVAQRELDVKDHAKALGLSLEDVEKLKGEKEYGRFKAMQDRLDKERSELEDDENEEEEEETSAGRKILDGLGGITNRREQ
jgi:hypothetical protein